MIGAEDHPLQLADAPPAAAAAPRFQSHKTPPSSATMLISIGVTLTKTPGSAGGAAGGSQP
jgi:hypothetical protein